MREILETAQEILKRWLMDVDDQCPNCGYYCTGKTVFCTKGL